MVAGGSNHSDGHILHEDQDETRFPLKSAEIFDVESETWSDAAYMPTGLMRGSMVLFEGPNKSKFGTIYAFAKKGAFWQNFSQPVNSKT